MIVSLSQPVTNDPVEMVTWLVMPTSVASNTSLQDLLVLAACLVLASAVLQALCFSAESFLVWDACTSDVADCSFLALRRDAMLSMATIAFSSDAGLF